MTDEPAVLFFRDLGSQDTPRVGGKNASLGEMLRALSPKGIRVPDGFATTASAYRNFLQHNDLEEKIRDAVKGVAKDDSKLASVGKKVRKMILDGEFPESFKQAIEKAYKELCGQYDEAELAVAVRSSATAEDLPEASFAGQQDTFLNIRGGEALLKAVKACFASIFTDRAIAYREEKGFDHMQVALSAGVQKMVRADVGGAGVLFTLDSDSGFRDVVVINAAFGLGEPVVGGEVNADEYVVFKPLLDESGLKPILSRECGRKEIKTIYTDDPDEPVETIETEEKEQVKLVLDDEQILALARWGCEIELHYDKPMDIEWALDGKDGQLYIVQARPETVQSQKDVNTLKSYRLKEKSKELARGLAVGKQITKGVARCLSRPGEEERFEKGDVLVTEQTDPDWGPLMKRAAAVITDKGSRTAHAAIVSRELNIPAVVGAGNATEQIKDGTEVTVSCAEGEEGVVFEGLLEIDEQSISLEEVPETDVTVMMNIASPGAAFRWHQLPCKGIGLARMEFIVNNIIKVHPLALTRFDDLEDKEAKQQIEELTRHYADKSEYFVDKLASGIAWIAASQYPHDVVVRLSDFKTNEYADLIGGQAFEPEEENPMLGFRGAARYHSERYCDAFALECDALRRVRDEVGLTNVVVMIPFVRSPEECDRVLEIMAEHGLVRGRNGLRIYLMAEIPSNIFEAKAFAQRCDGFSIGSNDLTQLVLGVSRDSEELSDLFDERNPAVTTAIRQLLETAHAEGVKVGICGQGPSDKPDFAEFLVRHGIDSISLNPDSVVETLRQVADIEQR
ncbi:MAG: phosphoenolpyruvate synthase [Verrucomicrobiota bacterium]